MKRYSPLLVILVLLGSLVISQAASAATSSPPNSTPAALVPHAAAEPEEEPEGKEEEFEVEEEFEFEECQATGQEAEFDESEEAEEEEFEFEEEAGGCEGVAGKGTKGEDFVTAPAQCLVQRAESTLTTLPGTDRLLLTVHYKNYASAAVAIGLKLKDGKGSLTLEHTTKHLGRGGTLHLTANLGDAEMDRAAKAKEFNVALRAANTPGYCAELLEQHLVQSKHTAAQAHGSRVYGKPAAA
jgi:hypothetical protein